MLLSSGSIENIQSIKNCSKIFRSRALSFVLSIGQRERRDSWSSFMWNQMKKITCSFYRLQEKHFEKHQSTEYIMDSNQSETCVQSNFKGSVSNLVHQANTTCRAYRLQDSIIYGVPECVCESACETLHINENVSPGNIYRFSCAIILNFNADMPGTVIRFPCSHTLMKICIRIKCLCSLFDLVFTSCLVCNRHDGNIFPSEPIFMPAPDATVNESDTIQFRFRFNFL